MYSNKINKAKGPTIYFSIHITYLIHYKHFYPYPRTRSRIWALEMSERFYEYNKNNADNRSVCNCDKLHCSIFRGFPKLYTRNYIKQ